MEIFLPSLFEIGIVLKLLLALALGALIGLEREIKKKPAGLRTHAFVALGACLFTVTALGLFQSSHPDAMSRVLQGIIMGIGFLGAGVIFRAQGAVRGLTTAAEIWTLAAIGVLVGLGSYFLALTATVLILIILVPFKWFEQGLED